MIGDVGSTARVKEGQHEEIPLISRCDCNAFENRNLVCRKVITTAKLLEMRAMFCITLHYKRKVNYEDKLVEGPKEWLPQWTPTPFLLHSHLRLNVAKTYQLVLVTKPAGVTGSLFPPPNYRTERRSNAVRPRVQALLDCCQ